MVNRVILVEVTEKRAYLLAEAELTTVKHFSFREDSNSLKDEGPAVGETEMRYSLVLNL